MQHVFNSAYVYFTYFYPKFTYLAIDLQKQVSNIGRVLLAMTVSILYLKQISVSTAEIASNFNVSSHVRPIILGEWDIQYVFE